MKKRLIALTVLCCLIFPLVACSSGSSGGKARKDPYVFRIGRTEIAVGADFEAVYEKLGADHGREVNPNCLSGQDNIVRYTYPDFSIMTLAENNSNTERIYTISLESDANGLRTPEGIAIGDTRETVRATYGEPSEESNGNLCYRATGMALYFFFTDGGTVSLIEYRTE